MSRNNRAVIMNLVVKILFLIALAAGFASTEASAATCQGTTITPGSSDRLLCTKTFYGTGTCNSSDQLATLTDSTGWPNSTLVPPWEPSSISIVGGAIVDLGGNVNSYAFGGNSYTPDVMLWYSPRGGTSPYFFPAGTSMQFPASGGSSPPHLDLHVSCSSGTFAMFYTIYYTVP